MKKKKQQHKNKQISHKQFSYWLHHISNGNGSNNICNKERSTDGDDAVTKRYLKKGR
jgi:hypothetical protein